MLFILQEHGPNGLTHQQDMNTFLEITSTEVGSGKMIAPAHFNWSDREEIILQQLHPVYMHM